MISNERPVPIVSTSPPVPNLKIRYYQDDLSISSHHIYISTRSQLSQRNMNRMYIALFPSYLHLHRFPTPALGMLTVIDSQKQFAKVDFKTSFQPLQYACKLLLILTPQGCEVPDGIIGISGVFSWGGSVDLMVRHTSGASMHASRTVLTPG